jgi:hypothetical protein
VESEASKAHEIKNISTHFNGLVAAGRVVLIAAAVSLAWKATSASPSHRNLPPLSREATLPLVGAVSLFVGLLLVNSRM